MSGDEPPPAADVRHAANDGQVSLLVAHYLLPQVCVTARGGAGTNWVSPISFDIIGTLNGMLRHFSSVHM